MFSLYRNIASFKKLYNTCRRTGYKPFSARYKGTNIFSMNSIYIFFRRNSFYNMLFIHVLWKGQLTQNSMNIRICIQMKHCVSWLLPSKNYSICALCFFRALFLRLAAASWSNIMSERMERS